MILGCYERYDGIPKCQYIILPFLEALKDVLHLPFLRHFHHVRRRPNQKDGCGHSDWSRAHCDDAVYKNAEKIYVDGKLKASVFARISAVECHITQACQA